MNTNTDYFDKLIVEQKEKTLEISGVSFDLHDDGIAVSTAVLSIPNGGNFNIRKPGSEEVISWLCQEIKKIYDAVPDAEEKINTYYGIPKFRGLGRRIFTEKYPDCDTGFNNAFWTVCYIDCSVD